jgi:hypothetical protein
MTIKYFLQTGVTGLVPIDEPTLNEAKSRVMWDWANGGKMELIAITYKETKRKSHTLNTDY